MTMTTCVRARDLIYGARFIVEVSRKKILVEVIYVRPRRSAGDCRVVLRRVDTGRILPRPRALVDLLPAV